MNLKIQGEPFPVECIKWKVWVKVTQTGHLAQQDDEYNKITV